MKVNNEDLTEQATRQLTDQESHINKTKEQKLLLNVNKFIH